MAKNILFAVVFPLWMANSQEVHIIPSDVFVSTPGGSASVSCFSTHEIVDIEWLVNGTRFDNNLGPNVMSQFSSSVRTGRLDFVNLPLNYNGTSVQCIAELDSGELTSSSIILLIQGLLSAVISLSLTEQDSTIFLTWTAPFTLDITDVDPDIEGYCVDVYKSNTSSPAFHSECGINTTDFSYPTPPDSVCHKYIFTVTPVNLVGNGTRTTEQFVRTDTAPEVSEISRLSRNLDLIAMSAVVCTSVLTLTDTETGDVTTVTNVTLDDNIIITVSTDELTTNRYYNVSLTARNVFGTATSFGILSTHDIDDVISQPSSIVMTLYSEHSDARGALFDFVFIHDNGDVNFTRSVLLALDRNTSLNHTLPFNLHPGQYRVFVYDIESDGTLSNGVGYPAVTKELVLQSGNGQGSFSNLDATNCQITAAFTISGTAVFTISAVCTFPNDAITTGFQVVAQLSSSTKVHKLYINQSMDLQMPVTVEVEESGIYLVTIFAIRNGTILNSYMEQTITTISLAASPNSGLILKVPLHMCSLMILAQIEKLL